MLEAMPLLILGLGGMGTLCIRYIKEKLIERYGMIPPFIQLLAFDTTGQERGGKEDSLHIPLSQKRVGKGLVQKPVTKLISLII